MATRREELENEGIKSIEITLDMTTYGLLEELMEKSGYDKDKREKLEGVSGVITQLINSPFLSEEEQKEPSRKTQRTIILKGLVKYLQNIMKYSNKEIAVLFNSKRKSIYTEKHEDKLQEKWSGCDISWLGSTKTFFSGSHGVKRKVDEIEPIINPGNHLVDKIQNLIDPRRQHHYK